MNSREDLVTATCHCGAVRLHLPAVPATMVDCNCTICRRLGALWSFYPREQVRLEAAPDALQAYVWGARTIRTMRCAYCGCATHWAPLADDAPADARWGVNVRMLPPQAIAATRVRRFDGLDSWTYLDA